MSVEALPIMCARCFDEVAVFPATCEEKPERLGDTPLGMYHCPDCGTMVLAGLEHPMLCARCIKREHPSYDIDTEPAVLQSKADPEGSAESGPPKGQEGP